MFFFEDAPGRSTGGIPGSAEDNSTSHVVSFLNSAEGLQLNRSFVTITDRKVRKKTADLVKSLSGDTKT